MANQKKVVLWSRKGCHYCSEVKAFLEENHYEYENIDVEGKDVLRDVLEVKYGIRHVPVVEVGSQGSYKAVLEGDLNRLKELLA